MKASEKATQIISVINSVLPERCSVTVNGALVKVADVDKNEARDLIKILSLVPEKGTELINGFYEWYQDVSGSIIFHYSPILKRIMIG